MGLRKMKKCLISQITCGTQKKFQVYFMPLRILFNNKLFFIFVQFKRTKTGHRFFVKIFHVEIFYVKILSILCLAVYFFNLYFVTEVSDVFCLLRTEPVKTFQSCRWLNMNEKNQIIFTEVPFQQKQFKIIFKMIKFKSY